MTNQLTRGGAGGCSMNLTENITDRHMALGGIRDAEVACALEFAMAGEWTWDVLWAIAQNRADDDTLADLVDLIADAQDI